MTSQNGIHPGDHRDRRSHRRRPDLDTILMLPQVILTPILLGNLYTSQCRWGMKEVTEMLLVDTAVIVAAVGLTTGLLWIYDRL